MRPRNPTENRQQGTVAIIVGLSLFVLIGFAGLVLDLGRLFVNKTELQTSADACALAAASQLTCDPSVAGNCTATDLSNAENAGVFASNQNRRDLQANAATIAPADIKFSTVFAPNSNYVTRGGASPNSKYVMCTARSNGIVPWFMGVLGVGASNVAATAVATLSPSQAFCTSAPMGICQLSNGTNWGYSVGQWIPSTFTSSGNNDLLTGGFKWVDFTINAGGNSEIRDQLAGNGVCNVKIGDQIQQPGQQQGAKSAYNTRFGIYPNGANAYTAQTAPPDWTGYAYPNQSPGSPVIPINTSAYSEYSRNQGLHTPFTPNEYAGTGPPSSRNINGTPSSSATHATYGGNRRLVAIPVIDCNAGNTTPIVGMACALMLNPMSNGANGTIYLEYLGDAKLSTSPCSTGGLPGNNGPLVPALVQ